MTSTSVRSGIVHIGDRLPQVSGAEMVAALVPPPQFDGATFESYRVDPAFPSQQEAKETLMAFAGASGAPTRGGGTVPTGQEGSRAQAGRLPGRWIRRRQNAPPRLDLPRHAGAQEVLRLVHRVHRAGGRDGLPEDRGAVPRIPAALHRRVRARRSGRHDGHDASARRTRRHGYATGRDLQHPAQRARRGPLRRAGLPARDPRDDARASRPCASTAPTTASARSTATQRSSPTTSTSGSSRTVRAPRPSPTTRSPRSSSTSPRCTRAGTSGSSTASRSSASATSRRWRTSPRPCASSPSSTARTTRRSRCARRAHRSIRSSVKRCSAGGYRKKYLRAISRLVALTHE